VDLVVLWHQLRLIQWHLLGLWVLVVQLNQCLWHQNQWHLLDLVVLLNLCLWLL
jgi:hypothetical protein